MDITSIISACIGGGIALIGVIIQNGKSQAIMQTQLENLTKQVEKHNSIVERTFKLEAKVEAIEAQMSND